MPLIRRGAWPVCKDGSGVFMPDHEMYQQVTAVLNRYHEAGKGGFALGRGLGRSP